MVRSARLITCSEPPVLPQPRRRCPGAGAARAPRPCPAALTSAPREGARAQHRPWSVWVEIWEAPVRSAPFPALTMSICCCLFFRDYGSSKRKSGKTPGFFICCMILERSLPPAFPLLFTLRGMKLCSSLTFYCWILARDKHQFLSFELYRTTSVCYIAIYIPYTVYSIAVKMTALL